jgi:hypothetical protein
VRDAALDFVDVELAQVGAIRIGVLLWDVEDSRIKGFLVRGPRKPPTQYSSLLDTVMAKN